MRSEIRTAIAAVVATVVVMASATMALAADGDPVDPDPTATTPTASTPTPTEPTPTATPTPTPTIPATTRTIDDAQLRWGINNESNNKAFAPGTFNFLSAGKIGNPGEGNKQINPKDQGATWNNGKDASWKAADGNVALQKYVKKSWRPATFAGVRTNSSEVTMTGNNGFSNHEIVLSGGTGTVDRTKRTASIQWTGSFTVVYYSGYSFFYVTDPKLTVSGGVGKLTATLSGFGSAMDDLEKWEAVTPVENVVLANLPGVDLGSDRGFTAKPAYTKVAVSVPSDQTEQIRNGATWGSFPQSFINFQTASGTASYWYSSGGAADAHKIALPVTVSYAAGAPVKVTPPPNVGGKTPDIDNSAPDAPAKTNSPAPAPVPIAPPAALAAPLPVDAAPQSAAVTTQFRPVSTITGIQPLPDDSSTRGIWILSGILLGVTLLVAVSPFAYSAVRRAS